MAGAHGTILRPKPKRLAMTSERSGFDPAITAEKIDAEQ
jgi:hypothetical protein